MINAPFQPFEISIHAPGIDLKCLVLFVAEQHSLFYLACKDLNLFFFFLGGGGGGGGGGFTLFIFRT